MGRNRRHSECAKGKKEDCDPVYIFAERERIDGGIERVRIKEVQRLMKRRVPIPIENPSIDVRVTAPSNRAIDVSRQRPRHRDAQQQEESERCGVLPRDHRSARDSQHLAEPLRIARRLGAHVRFADVGRDAVLIAIFH